MEGISRIGKNDIAQKKISFMRKKLNPDDDFLVGTSAFQNPSDAPYYPKRYQLLRLMEEWYY